MNANLNNEGKEDSSAIHLNNYINSSPQKKIIADKNNIIEISLSKNKKKISQLTLEKSIFSKFNKKYKIKYNPKRMYNELIMHTLLFNKNTHLVSTFKDYMIYDYIDEFFKRFYTYIETFERLPKFALFYKNYLKFFCQPCFSNFIFNSLVQKNREKKAEIFYNKNFRENNKEAPEDEGIIEDTDNEEEEGIGKSKIEKTIFNETVRKKIEQISPITNSMNLPESETYLKSDQSGLLISFENESSLKNILKNMINNKKKMKNKFGEEMSSIIKVKLNNNEVDVKNNTIHKNSSSNNKKNSKNSSKNNTSKKKENINTYKNKNNNFNKEKKNNKINIKDKNNGIITKIIKYNTNKNNNINKKNKLKSKYMTEKLPFISSNNLFNNKNNIVVNNENKDKNIYIKKIELIKLNKTRSNSNRNTKFKDKLSANNINSDNSKNNNINNNNVNNRNTNNNNNS